MDGDDPLPLSEMTGKGQAASGRSVEVICQGLSICLDGLSPTPLVEKAYIFLSMKTPFFYMFSTIRQSGCQKQGFYN